ncbi:MAG: hypothetical protein AAF431_13725 [Pseudomonadota bacterium]
MSSWQDLVNTGKATYRSAQILFAFRAGLAGAHKGSSSVRREEGDQYHA